MTQRANLEITRKSTKAYLINFKKDKAVVDITDWQVFMTIKANMEDSDEDAKLRKKIIEHLNGKEGQAIIELTSEDTDITAGNYYYSIDYRNSEDDEEDIVIQGTVRISEPVLKDRSI